MRKNSTLRLHTYESGFDDTLVWVCVEGCMAQLEDGEEILQLLNEMGEVEHLLFRESIEDREDFIECVEIMEEFSEKIAHLLEGLSLAKNTIFILSAEEDSSFLGKHIADFRLDFDVEANAVVVYCAGLHSRLGHSRHGLKREFLITIAHELGHVYTGKVYDEDGYEVEIEDNHGPDEDEVEAFGREWADLVLQNAPESEIYAVISEFKADIERLKLAIESGEIDPYTFRPNPSHEWVETQNPQNLPIYLTNSDTYRKLR